MIFHELIERFSREFTPGQARLLAEAINDSYRELVKARDFNELKEVVRDLGEAQKRTETRMEELAEAQKRTETRMGELTESQKLTQVALAKLADSQVELRQTVGSLSETMGLSLENEAYRNLPAFLEREHNLSVTKRMVRHIVGGEEIDFLAEARRGKTPVLVVGESKTKLNAQDVTQLLRKAETVKAHYKKRNGHEIVPLMIVHRAREKEIQNAKKKGVIVVQSFEM